jgi:hypothetical protein
MADKNSFAFLSRSAPLLGGFGINAYGSPIALHRSCEKCKGELRYIFAYASFSSLKHALKIFDNQCPELLELEKAYFPSQSIESMDLAIPLMIVL